MTKWAWTILLVTAIIPADLTWAGLGHHRRAAYCEPCPPSGPQLVPIWVKEKRTVQELVCRPVQKEKTIQVPRTVVETKTETRLCTVMKPVTETRTVRYLVRIPEWKEIEQTVPVCVPKVITCQGTRRVCKRIPVQTVRTVCYDAGQWVCQTDKCGRVSRVWCPNIVTKQVPVTTYRIEWEDVPYTYQRTTYETKYTTRKVRVCTYRCEERTKEVPCVRYVPETVERKVRVPVCKVVTEAKKVRYTEWVSEVVEKEIEVSVCKWVPAQCDTKAAPEKAAPVQKPTAPPKAAPKPPVPPQAASAKPSTAPKSQPAAPAKPAIEE